MTTQPLIAEFERALTDDDLLELETNRGSKAPEVKRLRARHHRLARLLAEGIPPGDAALQCDYSLSRVSILQDDPMFRELVAYYMQEVKEQYVDLHKRLSEISADALSVLSDRLEDDPERFENVELMKLAAMGADRVGHGPSSTQNHTHLVSFAARLDAARERTRQLRAATPVEDAEILDE